MQQPNFFAKQNKAEGHDPAQIVLLALGEFQARGKVLAARELPLDRLLGALRRAAVDLDVDELTDEQIATTLTTLGACVRLIPSFVAKHPYRVTVQPELAERSLSTYRALTAPKEISESPVK